MKRWKRVAITVERIFFLDMVEKFSKILIASFCISAQCLAPSRRFGFQKVLEGVQIWSKSMFRNVPRTSDLANEKKTVQLERNWCT